ncbi:MAG: RCC1 domain-containing protein [Gemmatimonadota bacterium]
MTIRHPIAAVTPLAMAFVLACSDTVGPKEPVPHVVAVSGGGQSGAVLDTLPEWLVVRVIGDGGQPLADVPVTWSSEDETARAIPVEPVTNREGIARAIAVLGFTAGAQQFHAAAKGFDDRAIFALTAVREAALKAVALMNASASSHMCALDAEGRAWCWGQNFYGQLGDGTTQPADAARPVLTALRFRSIAAGYATTCAIALDHALWCWGANQGAFGTDAGIFGNGTIEGSPVPVRAATGLSVVDIDIDGSLACAVTTVGEAWCWGRIIGPAGGANTLVPVKVESSRRWRDISVSGSDRACAVSLEFVVHCWAAGPDGAQRAGIEGDYNVPQPVPGIPPVVEVTVGWWNQCGRLASGSSVVCWGPFLNGTASTTPVQYPRLEGGGFARVADRAETVMALGTDGGLHIWGYKPHCCDGFISVTPSPLAPSHSWLDLAVGTGAYGILASDSTVHYWYPFPDGPPSRLVPQPVLVEE